MRNTNPAKKNERGITIMIVGITLLALVAMAALAIDVASLYQFRSEAQRAADAAALAGAKMFVTSSYTSRPDAFDLAFGSLCENGGAGSTAAVNKQVEAAAQVNLIAGLPATIKNIQCINTNPQNPRVTVTVQSENTPTFFARIWNSSGNIVSATATAEAYNASGQSLPIGLTNVKPWLIPNCDPDGFTAPCSNGYFINPSNGTIKDPALIGTRLFLNRQPSGPLGGSGGTLDFYGLDYPALPAPSCPSSGAVSCGSPINQGDHYIDNIACTSSLKFYCGQQIGPGTNPQILIHVESQPLSGQPTVDGTKCLIHASSNGGSHGQDEFSESGVPVTITGGDNNPNSALQVPNISRSDSVVTVPLYDGHQMCSDPASGPGTPNGTCVHTSTQPTATVIGFLQLGIKETNGGQLLDTVILNAVGCTSDVIGDYPPANPISAGGSSPIPVRLVQTP